MFDFFLCKKSWFQENSFFISAKFYEPYFLYVWIKGINVLEGIKKSFRFGELFRGMVFKQ